MINYPHSTFTWKSFPAEPHPYYKRTGFVGTYGQVHHVRVNIDATCDVREEQTGMVTELFLSAPCRAEYTIATRNLIQVPSGEWRIAFSRESMIPIARQPSTVDEKVTTDRLSERYEEFKIDLLDFPDGSELKDGGQIVEATLAGDLLNAQSTYRDAERGLTVTVGYPINLINLNQENGTFQVCTGPVLLPDLATWDGREVSRVFLAEAAFSQFDHVEFILRREVQPSEEDKKWLHQVRGRDRRELRDPSKRPPGDPMRRPGLPAYNEVWELEATNAVTRAENR